MSNTKVVAVEHKPSTLGADIKVIVHTAIRLPLALGALCAKGAAKTGELSIRGLEATPEFLSDVVECNARFVHGGINYDMEVKELDAKFKALSFAEMRTKAVQGAGKLGHSAVNGGIKFFNE